MWKTRWPAPGQVLLAPLGLQHAFQGGLQVVGHLINDVVAADLNAQPIGQHAGVFVGHDREADDHGVGRMGQMHVGLRDAAYRGLEDLQLHFGVLKLRHFLRMASIEPRTSAPQNDIERLHLALLSESFVQGFQGDVGLPAAEIALAGGGAALFGQMARLADAVEHVKLLAGAGRHVQAGHVHGRGRARLAVFLGQVQGILHCFTRPNVEPQTTMSPR